MRNQFFRTLSAWCFKSTLSTYEPTMLETSYYAALYVMRSFNSSCLLSVCVLTADFSAAILKYLLRELRRRADTFIFLQTGQNCKT